MFVPIKKNRIIVIYAQRRKIRIIWTKQIKSWAYFHVQDQYQICGDKEYKEEEPKSWPINPEIYRKTYKQNGKL